MTHPTSMFADFVAGTLGPSERAEVDAHLASCAACRREVAAADTARMVLRRLPAVAAPSDVGLAAVAEAERATSDTTVRPMRGVRTAPVWTRWAVVAGAAAAIVLVAGIVLPNLGGRTDVAGREDGAAEAEMVATAATTVEILDADLGTEEIQGLATSFRSEQGGAASTNPPSGVGAPEEVETSPAAVQEAISCLETAFGPLPFAPVRLIEARVDGEPAVIGVVLSGPGADEPADTAEVYVADRRDCSVISSTRAEL